MKHAYRCARPFLAALFLLIGLSASAQPAWRPFRPGLIYTYQAASPAQGWHTLRVDSSYVTVTGDSVYAFNRLMRHPASGGSVPAWEYYRSRNNLFGARLRWHPGTAEFFLETNAEAIGATVATVLRLLPRAAVGSSWSASTQPTLTATLTSRSFVNSATLADTVATITLSNGQQIQLGRQTGLIKGPQWLNLGGTNVNPVDSWTASSAPQTLAQSPYSPLALFSMQPGDELGYIRDPFTILPIACSSGVILRRILSRQQTVDSLVITYQQQERTQNSGAPGCGTSAGIVISPVYVGRWAFSLRTGKSVQFPALPLLNGEYASRGYAVPFAGLIMGLAIALPSGGTRICQTSPQVIYQTVYYNQAGTPPGGYSPGLDYLAYQQWFGVADPTAAWQTGLGELGTIDQILSYVRRTQAGSNTPFVCGNPITFAGLLPTRAAQAAAIATLHPNPATEAATLTLATPAPAAACA